MQRQETATKSVLRWYFRVNQNNFQHGLDDEKSHKIATINAEKATRTKEFKIAIQKSITDSKYSWKEMPERKRKLQETRPKNLSMKDFLLEELKAKMVLGHMRGNDDGAPLNLQQLQQQQPQLYSKILLHRPEMIGFGFQMIMKSFIGLKISSWPKCKQKRMQFYYLIILNRLNFFGSE